MNKFLIFGASSRLASAFILLYQNMSQPLSKEQCNINKSKDLEKALRQFTGKYVLNTAAITHLGKCEQNPQICLTTNALALVEMERLCQKYHKKLIIISSDYAVNPVNVYGWSKFLAERLIIDKALVVRTNFYDQHTYLVQQLLQKGVIEAYSNVVFNPVSINRLAREIFRHRNDSGLINVFSRSPLTYTQFAEKFCQIFVLDKSKIRPVKFINRPGRFRRPLQSFIKPDCDINIETDLKDFKKYLTDYVH